MRGNLDLTPLFRSSVGFDRLDKLFDAAFREATRDVSYPPYNILKTGPDQYRITMAVAGFAESDIDIVAHENVLTVRGQLKEQPKDVEYLYKGIAQRAFEHRFQLADYVRVVGASLTNGLLDINLERIVPEEKKPRRIEIGGDAPRTVEARPAGKQAEPKAAAA
jgi:molecular chaperone IbpA